MPLIPPLLLPPQKIYICFNDAVEILKVRFEVLIACEYPHTRVGTDPLKERKLRLNLCGQGYQTGLGSSKKCGNKV